MRDDLLSALQRSSDLEDDFLSVLHRSSVLKDLLFPARSGTISSDDKVLLLWITIEKYEEHRAIMQGYRLMQKLPPIVIRRMGYEEEMERFHKEHREKMMLSRILYVLSVCFMLISDDFINKDAGFLRRNLEFIKRCIRRIIDYRKRYIMKWEFRNGPCRTDLIQNLMEYSDICLICHENHHLKDRVILSCGHVFGRSCLEPWIEVGT